MRLKPYEVKIVNAIRGVQAGKVTVIKHQDGQLQVQTSSVMAPMPGAVKQSQGQGQGLRLKD